jgi:hypothetical protein
MEGRQAGVRITFDDLTRAEANRAVQELRRAVVERVGGDVVASIEKGDTDSQDAGATLVLLFGSSAGAAIAQGIRAYLARRTGDRDRITIRTADGTEVVATGEAARTLDAAALIRAVHRARKSRSVILFLAANPRDTSPLAIDQECAAIERELSMTAFRDDFELRSKWAVNVDELARHLLELAPTIIHFSGHGTGSEPARGTSSAAHRNVIVDDPGAGCGGIYLHGEPAGSQLVTARALAMMINSATDSARVVVLNACYSEAQADELCTVVDCVVGMTGAIGDDAARSFAVGLYRALGNRRSVGNAVEHAVATLAALQLPDEHLPRCRTRVGVDANRIMLGPPI